VIWLIIRIGHSPKRAWYKFATLGALIGLTALIKPHALFVIPGAWTYFVVCRETKTKTTVSFQVLGLTFSALLTKLIVGFCLAGTAGLSILGDSYGQIVDTGSSKQSLASTIEQGFLLTPAHILSLITVVGLPLFVVLGALIAGTTWRSASVEVRAIALMTVTLTVTYVLLASEFTALVSGQGPYETLTRIHERYYFFIFPLWIVVAVASRQLLNQTSQVNSQSRFASAAPILFAIALVISGFLRNFESNIVDGPEYVLLEGMGVTHVLIACFSLSLVLISLRWPQFSMSAFIIVFLPLYLCAGMFAVQQSLNQPDRNSADNRAGRFLAAHPGYTKRAAVVGNELAGLFRIAFYVDDPNLQITQSPANSPTELEKLPAGVDNVIIQMGSAVNPGSFKLTKMDGFTLATRK
jgi:phosphoglycerol transferase